MEKTPQRMNLRQLFSNNWPSKINLKFYYTFILSVIFSLIVLGLASFRISQNHDDDRILSYIANPKTQNIQLYWKDDSGQILQSIQNLKMYVEHKHNKLLFAMNAGMFTKENSPKGLFIQNGNTIVALDTLAGNGNFYLKPNGVFYIKYNNTAGICKTSAFKDVVQVKFATQSGPMLVIDGKVHPAITKGSLNLNIRNGVGILPDGRVIFAMSKQEINFYDFALFFKNMGCRNALYLDGLVSRMYLPERNWLQTDGDFGVMIGVTKSEHN